MDINDDFEEIMKYAYFWNWLPDWNVVQKRYDELPKLYSILISFVYSYLQEIIRSTTSEYGRQILNKEGKDNWDSFKFMIYFTFRKIQ